MDDVIRHLLVLLRHPSIRDKPLFTVGDLADHLANANRLCLTGAVPSGLLSFSEREQQVIRCLATGQPNKQIAQQLNITEGTVKVHVKGLLRKTRLTNRTQLAIWALNPDNGIMKQDHLDERD